MVVHILGKGFKGKEVVKIALASKFYGVGLKTAEKLCSKLAWILSMDENAPTFGGTGNGSYQ